MGNIKGRVAALPLAALMLLTAVGPVTAFAADQSSQHLRGIVFDPTGEHPAIVNGEMVLVETYKVPTSMIPMSSSRIRSNSAVTSLN